MKTLRKVFADWKETYLLDKTLFWAELLGTVMGMIAAGTLGIMANNPPMMFVFVMYTISSVLMVYAMRKRKSISPMILMMFYTVVNIIGIFRI